MFDNFNKITTINYTIFVFIFIFTLALSFFNSIALLTAGFLCMLFFVFIMNSRYKKTFAQFKSFVKNYSNKDVKKSIEIDNKNIFFSEFKELMNYISNMVTVQLETKEELRDQAYKDSLTKLYNRRYFCEISETFLRLSKRKEYPLCVLMLDIDNFKNINDNYGHIVGDEVIVFFAEILNSVVRCSDVVSRFGGDEFAILLPKTDRVGAKRAAEKIINKIRESLLKTHDHEIQFTASIGVGEFDYINNNSVEYLVDSADKFLYIAKQSGKDRVC